MGRGVHCSAAIFCDLRGLARRRPVMNVPIRMPHPMPVAIHMRRIVGISRIARRDAEQTLNAADNAANRAADHGPDRPRRVVADISAMRDAVGNTLRLRRERHGEHCGKSGRDQNVKFHATTLS
jgi:hypothetical protein